MSWYQLDQVLANMWLSLLMGVVHYLISLSHYPILPETLNCDGAFMQEFFDDVELVKENIVAIRNATTRVGEINQQVSDEFPEVI